MDSITPLCKMWNSVILTCFSHWFHLCLNDNNLFQIILNMIQKVYKYCHQNIYSSECYRRWNSAITQSVEYSNSVSRKWNSHVYSTTRLSNPEWHKLVPVSQMLDINGQLCFNTKCKQLHTVLTVEFGNSAKKTEGRFRQVLSIFNQAMFQALRH